MPEPSVLYLAINLPASVERRESLIAQKEKFGIDLQIVEAVAGNALTDEDRASYNSAARLRQFKYDLTNNEIACVLSHRKCLKMFLESDADYLVIMEDDAELAPHFNEGIRELTQHLQGWEVAKLFTDDGELFPLMPTVPGAAVQAVFPKKILWMSIGYMYTRTGAQAVYKAMQYFSQPSDVLIANAVLFGKVPTIGVKPGLIRIHSLGEQSVIDAEESRKDIPEYNQRNYFAHRLHVWRTALRKMAMRRMMRRTLSRKG